jgi:hypothetical protein
LGCSPPSRPRDLPIHPSPAVAHSRRTGSRGLRWPDGDANHPGPWAFTSPQSRDAQGNWSSQISDVRFETDIPAIDFACNVITGAGCAVPPNGAAFYPWFHLITANGGCAWALSKDIPGQLDDFGGLEAAWTARADRLRRRAPRVLQQRRAGDGQPLPMTG